MQSDPLSIADARRAFVLWAERAGPALADVGAPVRSSTTIAADSARDAIAGEPLMGWSIIEAAHHVAAVQFVQNHPFLSRGGIVQVSEPI